MNVYTGNSIFVIENRVRTMAGQRDGMRLMPPNILSHLGWSRGLQCSAEPFRCGSTALNGYGIATIFTNNREEAFQDT